MLKKYISVVLTVCMLATVISAPSVFAETADVVWEYTETFDSSAHSFTLDGWTHDTTNGNIVATVSQKIGKFNDPDNVLANAENYEIQAQFECGTYSQNAIIFKANEAYSKYIMFRREASKGYTEFYEIGGRNQIAKGEISAGLNSNTNGTNIIRVVVQGNTYTGYINGTKMLEYTDTVATTDYRAGVRSALHSQDANVKVDNFKVTNLDKPAVTELTDTFENDDNWTASSYWSVADGKATATAQAIYGFQENGGILTTPTTVDDYTISADFMTAKANEYHGIIFRRSGNSFYMFRTEYAKVTFYKFVSGAATKIGEAASNKVVTTVDTPYNLKVVVKGNTFTGYFDGEELLTVTDDTFATGTIGLRSNGSVSVDNFYVCRDDSVTVAMDVTDGFDSDVNWTGDYWTVSGGKATVADTTKNALYTFQTDGGILTNPKAIDDYIVSADFTTPSSTSLHAVAFRIQGNNAYLFRVKNGYAEFFKIGTGQGTLASVASADIAIANGDTYNLRVVVQGDSFIGYYNDIKVLSLTDATLTTGDIGIRSNGAVTADNFYVCRGDANLRLADIDASDGNVISMISADKNICAVAIDDTDSVPQITAKALNSEDTVEITQSASFDEPAVIKISSGTDAEKYTVYFMEKKSGWIPSAQIYTDVSQVDDSIIITSKVFNTEKNAEFLPIAAVYAASTNNLLKAVSEDSYTVTEDYEITEFTFPYISLEQEELTIKTFLLNDISEISPLCKPAVISHTQPAKTFDVASIFSDHMVLQRNEPINVWGKAVKGETVTVTLAGQTKSVVSENGFWELQLDPEEAGGPYELTISSGDETITCTDVLVGEVWVCAGQSNMMWKFKNTDEYATDVLEADEFSNVRYFYQDTIRDSVPKFDVQNGEWQIVSSETAGEHAALSYYFGTTLNRDLDVPIGLINVAVGSTAIQAHMDEKTIASVKNYMTQPDDDLETCVYNSMIKPLQPYTNAGVLWYQGEANSARNEQATYKHLLTALIEAWREQWRDDDLPFINVQLPGYYTNTIYKWPVIREAYVDVMNSMDNVGMVVTIDTGLINDIHPTEKKPVALRLAAVAKAMVYGMDIPYMSPMYKEMTISGNEIELTFDYVYDGFKYDGEEILGFEICGEDQLFTPADVRIEGTNKLIVSSDKVDAPVAVRYAWEQFPTVNLYNSADFPVCPFRTDDYDAVTKKME